MHVSECAGKHTPLAVHILLYFTFIIITSIHILQQLHTRQRGNNNNINPLNPELNPICYLLALLGAHHFLHVSRIRVKVLTFRRLMSYIWSTHS